MLHEPATGRPRRRHFLGTLLGQQAAGAHQHQPLLHRDSEADRRGGGLQGAGASWQASANGSSNAGCLCRTRLSAAPLPMHQPRSPSRNQQRRRQQRPTLRAACCRQSLASEYSSCAAGRGGGEVCISPSPGTDTGSCPRGTLRTPAGIATPTNSPASQLADACWHRPHTQPAAQPPAPRTCTAQMRPR